MEQGKNDGIQARRNRLIDKTCIKTVDSGACPPTKLIKAVVAAEIGAPSDGIYQAINKMVSDVVSDSVIEKQSIKTEDSSTVRLTGGNEDTPLKAQFADGAISAADSSISVVKNEDGTISLAAATVSNPSFTSPDNTIKITMAEEEGASVQFSTTTQFVGSSSVTITPSTIEGVPTYTFSIPSDLINPAPAASNTIPVSVTTVDSKLYLGIDPQKLSSNSCIPRTVVIGGNLGGAINITNPSNALTNAVAYINALPRDSVPTSECPWQILALPGVYNDDKPVTLPPNVNVKSLIPGTAQFTSPITVKDTGGSPSATVISGICIRNSLAIDTSSKTGGNFKMIVKESHLLNSATVTLRQGSESDIPDKIVMESCIITSSNLATLTVAGGLLTLIDTAVSTQQVAIMATGGCSDDSNAICTRIQVSGGCISSTVLQKNNTFLSLLSGTLDGSWTISGASAFCSIISSVVRKSWTLTPNDGSRTYISATAIDEKITRVDATGSYTWTSSNILASTSEDKNGTVDRDMSFRLLALPKSAEGWVTLVPALTTPFTPVIPTSIPIPWVQPKTATLSAVGGAIGIFPMSASTTSLVRISNGSSLASSNVSVSITVPVPDNTLWYSV